MSPCSKKNPLSKKQKNSLIYIESCSSVIQAPVVQRLNDILCDHLPCVETITPNPERQFMLNFIEHLQFRTA